MKTRVALERLCAKSTRARYVIFEKAAIHDAGSGKGWALYGPCGTLAYLGVGADAVKACREYLFPQPCDFGKE